MSLEHLNYDLDSSRLPVGIVFYDKGSVSDGWRGIWNLAAPDDQSTVVKWGCPATAITGADGTIVGTGKQNTIEILAGCTTTGIAADVCINFSLGGYDDWFLPSKDELNLMYTNLHLASTFSLAPSTRVVKTTTASEHVLFGLFGRQHLPIW